MSDKRIRIQVPALTRVEGEGALDLHIDNGVISKLQLRIFEPPRLFEKFLEGRHFTEVPDIVARICGICPVAYQMSAVRAFESLFEVQVGAWVSDMRRLFYCGEWLESHALHIHLLAAPDFLGYENAPQMAKDYPDDVKRGVRLQHLGNAILKFLGGRSVHPVGVRVGGFHHAPTKPEAEDLLRRLQSARADVQDLLPWVASLPVPDITQDVCFVALGSDDAYPLMSDMLVSSRQHALGIDQFEQFFVEHHEAHSTALYSLLEGEPYLVGPLARINLNRERLPNTVNKLLDSVGVKFPSQNMYHSIVARAIEIAFALEESIRILESYEEPDTPYEECQPRAGIAYGCSEAPRGILWHRYEVDDTGHILKARIVPPTSQNQARIEEDLRHSITKFGLEKEESMIRRHAEQVIRNYDPCISCATHFLDLRIHHQ